MAERDWLDVARSGTADDVREWILTGFKNGKPFTPYVPTPAFPGRLDRVLDFGCDSTADRPAEDPLVPRNRGSVTTIARTPLQVAS